MQRLRYSGLLNILPGSPITEPFFGAVIQLLDHRAYFGIGDLPEIGHLGGILPYQATGVLVGLLLAGAVRVTNVGRTDDAIRVYVFAAGLSASDLEVNVQDNVLTLRGKREVQLPKAEGEGRRPYFRRERFSGEFARSIALPDGLDIDCAEANFRNGVFEILLPKREELKPRRIEIQAA